MGDSELVHKAILETIFLWQRGECDYYKATRSAFEDRENEDRLVQFAKGEYYSFLNEYKVRRSLVGKGKDPVVKLVKDMFRSDGFAEKVMSFEENQNIIDDYCETLSQRKGISSGKRLLSLITKTAFILRPQVIPLFDRYAKESLEDEMNVKITDFAGYYKAFLKYKMACIDSIKKDVEGYNCIFDKFEEFSEFDDIVDFLAHRSIDKILWMKYYFKRK